MHILIAPNAFKNSLSADKAAEAISKGLHKSNLQCTLTCFPVGDGGDGTGSLLIEHLKGEYVKAEVHDPLGRKIKASMGLIHEGQTAVIEMADASGLRLLKPDEYDPLHATTFGTGELIREAINRNVETIMICVGGSATVDGGTGMLRALGVTFLDKEGRELNNLPADLPLLATIDTTEMIRFENGNIVVLCDVRNTLLGPQGSAAVFGPQKGADAKDVQLLEAGLTQLRDVALHTTGVDMAAVASGGAAGGIAAALYAFTGADLVTGIDYFISITGFEEEVAKADLVITGEGSLDAQTLQRKAPFGVAEQSKKYSVPVIGMGGKISGEKELLQHFSRLMPINDGNTDIETALKNTYADLERTACLLGNQLQQEKQDK